MDGARILVRRTLHSQIRRLRLRRHLLRDLLLRELSVSRSEEQRSHDLRRVGKRHQTARCHFGRTAQHDPHLLERELLSVDEKDIGQMGT